MSEKINKVFCVGFQKTGTTSLGQALEILGYKVCGYYPFRVYANSKDLTLEILFEKADELIQDYDAFKDTPWPIFYRELDEKYPNSKFILVIRETPSWIDSVVNDFGNYPNSKLRRINLGYNFIQNRSRRKSMPIAHCPLPNLTILLRCV